MVPPLWPVRETFSRARRSIDSLIAQAYIESMNKLNRVELVQIVATLVEGNSIRATCRMTGVAKGTVLKLLADLGAACSEYQRRSLMNLHSKRIQCDEIWSFCYAKEKSVPEHMKGKPGVGDVWTWTAMDADSKLMISWLVGERDAGYAADFINDLAERLATRVQLTTGGLKVYLEAIEGAFGDDVDFAQLVEAVWRSARAAEAI